MATFAESLLGIGADDAPGEAPGSIDIPDEVVLSCYRAYRDAAKHARDARIRRNEDNLDVFMGLQDTSDKVEGQSTEFLPKVGVAVEQFVSLLRRATTDFGDYFTFEWSGQLPSVRPAALQKLLRLRLDTLHQGVPQALPFATAFADALKVGALESLAILKIYAKKVTQEQFVPRRVMGYGPDGLVEEETLERRKLKRYRLCIDPIPPHDYYPDPTGRWLYEIHEKEVDLHDLYAAGVYDEDKLDELTREYRNRDLEDRKERHKGQQESLALGHRATVIVGELWGTLLDHDGMVLAENIVTTIANDRLVIRKPAPNPNWHGESPFVAAPLIRVPFSTWHKALFDEAVSLNTALNDVANLMLDGCIASIWGTRQIRPDWLEDPKQVSGGVPQGVTLKVKAEVPPGAHVLETVATGQVPQDAMAIFGLFDKEFQVSALTNDLKLGNLPTKNVKATEIMEAQQGQSGLIDGITRDIENTLMAPVLRKAWLTDLQYMDDLVAHDVVEAIGERAALTLARMSPARRFAAFAGGSRFKVNGLSATLARARDVQKLMAFLEFATANPLLAPILAQQYNLKGFITRILRQLNIDPEGLELTEEEKQEQQQQQPPLLGGGMPMGAGATIPGGAGATIPGGAGATIPGGEEPPELPETISMAGGVGGVQQGMQPGA